MSQPTLSPTTQELLQKLAGQPDTDHQVMLDLFVNLSETLVQSLASTLSVVEAGQSHTLTAEEQRRALAKLHAINTETLQFINTFVDEARTLFKQATERVPVSNKRPMRSAISQLTGLSVLLADEDPVHREKFLQQLSALGMECTVATLDETLKILHSAQQQDMTYSMVIISTNHFDHHIAYLARTIKSNPAFQDIMLVLAPAKQLPSFEVENAQLSGFVCVVYTNKPLGLSRKLVSAWRNWKSKTNFTRSKNLLDQHRVLLVEDDPIAQKITERLITELGYAVDTATDGYTALKALEQDHYDIVLMDIGLPDISGLEVTEEFRKREGGLKHTPIIALTIYDATNEEPSFLSSGLDDHIVKPISSERLKAIFEHWVEKRGKSETKVDE